MKDQDNPRHRQDSRAIPDEEANRDSRNLVNQSLGEFATSPTTVIVHDPVASGSFSEFGGTDDGSVERDLLFRSVPDLDTYRRQYEVFVATLEKHVPRVIHLEELASPDAWPSLRTNPNHVFTRDAVITLPWAPDHYLPTRMREPLRRSESAVLETALQKLGLEALITLPEGLFLEGGDLIPFGRDGRRILLVGFGPRSRRESVHWLAEHLIPEFADEMIGIELAPWRMNLDGGFLPVSKDVALIEPTSILAAFCIDRRGCRSIHFDGLIDELGYRRIEVSREDSILSQACNAVCLGERTVIYYDLAPAVADELRRNGIHLVLIPGSELVKGRGGPRCMTRPVYKDV